MTESKPPEPEQANPKPAKPKPVPAAEVITALAGVHGCSQAEARRILASVQSAVQQIVVTGKTVRLPDLATFTPVDLPARQVRNPGTGEMQMAAATRQVRIAPASRLKAAAKAAVQ